jgi:hypothetical protein
MTLHENAGYFHKTRNTKTGVGIVQVERPGEYG